MSRSPLLITLLGAALPLYSGCALGIEDNIKHTDTAGTSDCGPSEIPYDGVDNDCDPSTPDDDLDGDGHNALVTGGDDCDDTNPDVSPGVAEIPYDGLDNDCDPGTPDDDLDGDGTNSTVTGGTDCDDSNPDVYPGAAEICNGLDDNCDGSIDGPDSVDAPIWYADLDADGYGDPNGTITACNPPPGFVSDATDCDDTSDAVNPAATEICNGIDDNCDGTTDDVACGGGYGGHRIDKGGDYYYALYNDKGFGILGASDWYGSSDAASAPEGVTWNEDQSTFYYNDLVGDVFMQMEPFGASSTKVGTFSLGQIGGGVTLEGKYYVGDYNGGNIYQMDLTTGATSLYASLGSTACKPYFGNNSMSIDSDGTVYAASSCGIVVYTPTAEATMLNSVSGLMSITAMDADNELYSLDSAGNIVHFDKASGAALGHVTIGTAPSTTWTMAVDENGDFIVNYWGEQRIFSHVNGATLKTWEASTYYPATSGYYWYVTF